MPGGIAGTTCTKNDRGCVAIAPFREPPATTNACVPICSLLGVQLSCAVAGWPLLVLRTARAGSPLAQMRAAPPSLPTANLIVSVEPTATAYACPSAGVGACQDRTRVGIRV